MKTRNAIIFACAAAIGAFSHARDFSREFADGDSAGQQWYNWSTGVSAEGTLWDLGGILPASEDNFTYKGENTQFYARASELENGTVYANSITLVSNYDGAFNADEGAVKIDVANDFNVKIKQSGGKNYSFGNHGHREGFQRITIGGSLTFDAVGGLFYTTFMNRYAYSTADLSMVVGGAVNFTQSSASADNRWIIRNGGGDTNPDEHYVNAYVQIGGLNGENLKLCTNDPGARSFHVIFKSDGKTPFTGGEWSGAMTSWYNGGKTGSITMDGGSDGGLQTIRLSNQAFSNDDAAMDLTLNMLSGRLSLSTDSVATFNKVDMVDGALYIDGAGGSFTTAVLNLNGGELVFDAWNGGNEFIEVAEISGALTDIVINLDANDFYVGMDVEGVSFDMFRGTTSADWEALGSRVRFMIDGKEVYVDGHVFSSLYGNGVLTLSGVISAVPEPAAVAAALGALALAFAAFRRRK